MVTVFLRGGLGNQMFQYAAGLAVAKKNRTELALDTTYLNDRFPRREFAYRTYDLDVFALDARLTALSRASAAVPIPGFWLGLDLALTGLTALVGAQKIVREKNARESDPSVLAASGNVVLWGRWQTEKYFKEIADEVRAAFRFRHGLTEDAGRIAEEIQKSNSVSLHVRRGDYAAFKSVEQLHGKTDLGYYSRAAAYVAARAPKPHFFVFSDDIPWCRENLEIAFPITFVPPEAAGSHDAAHLELMSLCRHHIVANSTFSWWGAWLGADPGKIVVAPARWYADGKGDGDIVPEGWIKV